jgi:hypothetical protein
MSGNRGDGAPPGSQDGSQHAQEPGSHGRHRAIIAAAQIPSGRLWATSRDGPCVYGMQEVRGSNPRSSTTQVRAVGSNGVLSHDRCVRIRMRSSTPMRSSAILQVRALIRAIPMLPESACIICKRIQIAIAKGAGQGQFSRRNLAREPGREPSGSAWTSAASGKGPEAALIAVLPCATARCDGVRRGVRIPSASTAQGADLPPRREWREAASDLGSGTRVPGARW